MNKMIKAGYKIQTKTCAVCQKEFTEKDAVIIVKTGGRKMQKDPDTGELFVDRWDQDDPQIITHQDCCPFLTGESYPRGEVMRFALRMEDVLRDHDDRPGWKKEPVPYLLARLGEEFGELCKAITNDDPNAIAHESIDVSNISMMIHDRVKPLI